MMNSNAYRLKMRKKEQSLNIHKPKIKAVAKKTPDILPMYSISANALRNILITNVPVQKVNCMKGKNELSKEVKRLTLLALERRKEVDYLLEKLELIDNKSVNEWQLRILIAELLWGRQVLTSNSPMVRIVQNYEQTLRESFVEVSTVIQNPVDKNKFFLPTYVRINTLSISIESSLGGFANEGWNLLPRCETYVDHLKVLDSLEGKNFIRDFHITELLVFPRRTSFYDHPGYINGKLIIQDKGSCLSSFLLNPKPGSVVFDMCAAIGLQTNHLANIMNNEGLIHAVDVDEDRWMKMNNFLSSTDVKCVRTMNAGYFMFNQREDVRYILIDPNCTYSGLFDDVERENVEKEMERFKLSHNAKLRYALEMFPNVKRVVYCVCSKFREEAEDNVNQLLKEVGDSYTLLDVREMLWGEWQSVSDSDFACGNKCLRIVPEFDLCQGYFIAVFERNFDVPTPAYIRKPKKELKLLLEEVRHTRLLDSNVLENSVQRNIPQDHVRTELFVGKTVQKRKRIRLRDIIRHQQYKLRKQQEKLESISKSFSSPQQ